MTAKERVRRFIRLAGIADAKGRPVPVMESPALNRAVVAYGDSIIAARTERRYRRTENRKAVREALAA